MFTAYRVRIGLAGLTASTLILLAESANAATGAAIEGASGETPAADSAAGTNAVTTNAPAKASSDATDGGDLTEIIVTANRREVSLQKSSLAIDAFSHEQLETAGVSQAVDLTKLVQGLQVGFEGATTQIYIRGIGDNGANVLANPGVAFNVDGVYVGSPEAVGVNFFDIERVEVLKGPQGTLYGRNTSGGAINLITNSPTFDTVKGTGNLEFGDYGLYHVDGAINLPVNDVVAVRVAANRVKRDGYLSDGTGDDDQSAARVKVLIRPNEDVSVLFSIDGEQVRGVGGGYVNLPRRPGSSPWEGTTSPVAVDYAHSFNPNLVAAGPPAPFVHNNFWATSLQLDWNLDFATLTVIPAYRHGSVDTLGYNAQSFGQTDTSSQETVEARLTHSSDALKWVTGLFYYTAHDPGQVFVYVGPGLLQSNPQYDPKATSYAAFGELTYSVNDVFRLIAGGRFTDENHKLTGNFYVSPSQDGAYIDEEVFYGDETFHSFTWKAGAEYDLAPQSMLYFTASTGFKSGGITQTVPPDNIYQPEQVLAFELGSRNRFFDNTLQLNLEAFDWKYKDQQNAHLTFDALGNVNFLTQNAGRANLYGLNADVLFRPTRNDAVHLAVEYDQSSYSSFTYEEPVFAYSPAGSGCANTGVVPGAFVPLAVLDCSGFALPHAPKWTGQLDLTHTIGLPNNGALDLNFGGRFSSTYWLSVDFTPAELAPSFAILNASVAYRAPGRNYSVTAYVRNLNNGREYTGGEEQTQAPPLFAAVISAPRTYGVQLHFDF